MSVWVSGADEGNRHELLVILVDDLDAGCGVGAIGRIVHRYLNRARVFAATAIAYHVGETVDPGESGIRQISDRAAGIDRNCPVDRARCICDPQGIPDIVVGVVGDNVDLDRRVLARSCIVVLRHRGVIAVVVGAGGVWL